MDNFSNDASTKTELPTLESVVPAVVLVVLRNMVDEYDAWPAPKPQFESYSIEHARALIAKHGGAK